MKMMKKLAMLVAAIILGGLGYAAYQRYAMQSDNVLIQKGCKYGKDKLGICKPKPVNWKDVGNDIQDAFTPSNDGGIADGLSCIHDGACKSGLCIDGTCRNQKVQASVASITINPGEIGASCSKDSQCHSGKCSDTGQCKINGGVDGEACVHNGYCQSGFCLDGTCHDKFKDDTYCLDDSDCQSGCCTPGIPCTSAEYEKKDYGFGIMGKCLQANDHVKQGRGHSKFCIDKKICDSHIQNKHSLDSTH